MEGRPSGPHLTETNPKDDHANAFYEALRVPSKAMHVRLEGVVLGTGPEGFAPLPAAAVDACGLEQGPTCFTLGTPAPSGSSHAAQGRHSAGRSGGSGRRPLQQQRACGSSARTRPLPTNSPSSAPLAIPAPPDIFSFAAAAAEGGVFRGFSAALEQPPVFTGAVPPATTAPGNAVAAAAAAAGAATAGDNARDPDESSTSPTHNTATPVAAADNMDTVGADAPRRGALDELISLLLLDDRGPGALRPGVHAPQQDSDAPGGGQSAAGGERALRLAPDDPRVVPGSPGHGSGPSHVSSPAVEGMYGKDGQGQGQGPEGVAADGGVQDPAIPAAVHLGLTAGGAGAGELGGSDPGGAASRAHRSPAAGALDLYALAAALEQVDAALGGWGEAEPDMAALLDAAAGLELQEQLGGQQQQQVQQGDVGVGPGAGVGTGVRVGVEGAGGSGEAADEEQPWFGGEGHGARRVRRAVRRRAGGGGGEEGGAGVGAAAGAARPEGAAGGWQLMLSVSTPHNPESLALLLLPGRLHKPQTARPAPLLVAAAAEAATTAAAAATAASPRSQQAQGAAGTTGPGAGSAAEDAASLGPAVALVRCTTAHEVAMALSLHGRRVYCEQRERGGAASWQPITVVATPPPGSADPVPQPAVASPSKDTQAHVRDPGPSTRTLVVSGLPDYIGADDLTALFGSGLLLPGHAPTPQDRRFLLVCPDHVSYQSLLAWNGAPIPDKPLDALRQIVPRVNGWCTLRVEEDDGLQLPSLMAELMASLQLGQGQGPRPGPGQGQGLGQGLGGAAPARARDSMGFPRGFLVQQQLQQQQQRPPRIAGRFHPADLDEMDELAAAEATEAAAAASLAAGVTRLAVTSGAVGAGPGVGGGVAAAGATAEALRHLSLAGAGRREEAGRVANADAAAAAAAERAQSSRGASSSGAAAALRAPLRPAARRSSAAARAAATAAAASVATGAAHAGCACCPPLGMTGGFGAGAGGFGDVRGWSGQAAVDLLNQLVSLGVEPEGGGRGASGGGSSGGAGGGGAAAGAGGGAEEVERHPFFRRSRKRFSTHFGRGPEDEEEEAEQEAGHGGEREQGAGAGAAGEDASGQEEGGVQAEGPTGKGVGKVGMAGEEAESGSRAVMQGGGPQRKAGAGERGHGGDAVADQ